MHVTIFVLRWILGVFFGLYTLATLRSGTILPATFSLLLTIFLLPPLARLVQQKSGKNSPLAAKIGSCFILFFLIASSSTPTSNKQVAIATPAPLSTVNPALNPIENTPPSSATDSTEMLPNSPNQRQEAVFLEVVDGDTIRVLLNGKTETIRVIGINTPETVDPRKAVECYGIEASNEAKNYFARVDKNVTLESDATQGERDKYNRLLRYIFTSAGTEDYGKRMILFGLANEYTYATPYTYQQAYKQAESQARETKRGFWADTACTRIPAPTPKPAPSSIKSTNTTATPKPQATTNKSCTGPDLDCQDFSSRADVLQFWNACGFSASNDPHRLDGTDDDGQPCERL